MTSLTSCISEEAVRIIIIVTNNGCHQRIDTIMKYIQDIKNNRLNPPAESGEYLSPPGRRSVVTDGVSEERSQTWSVTESEAG